MQPLILGKPYNTEKKKEYTEVEKNNPIPVAKFRSCCLDLRQLRRKDKRYDVKSTFIFTNTIFLLDLEK